MITNSELDLIAREVAETLTGSERADVPAGGAVPPEPDPRDEVPAR